MTIFEFTDDMCEITGYGGDYERCVRAAVTIGATWVSLHPAAEPEVHGNNGTTTGYVRGANDDGAQMLDCIDGLPFTMSDGRKGKLGDFMTPSMYYVMLHHIGWINEFGWNAYAEKMRSPAPLRTGPLPRFPSDTLN